MRITYTPSCVYTAEQRQSRALYPIFKLAPFKFNKIHIFENIHPAERANLMAGEDWEQETEKFLRAQPSPLSGLLIPPKKMQTPSLWLSGHSAVCLMISLHSEIVCLWLESNSISVKKFGFKEGHEGRKEQSGMTRTELLKVGDATRQRDLFCNLSAPTEADLQGKGVVAWGSNNHTMFILRFTLDEL